MNKKKKEEAVAELNHLIEDSELISNRLKYLIRQNDDLTLEIHNLRRDQEKVHLKIEILAAEIKGYL